MEIWKDIIGFEGLYQASNCGRIRSLNYNREKRVKILKQKINIHGYCTVTLFKNKKRHYFMVHRLVALTFIPNTQNLPQINHKDENKLNNNVDNLEWCSSSYNINYGSRNQKTAKKLSELKTGVLNTEKSKPVLQYTKSGEFIREFPSESEVQRQLGFTQANISSCCRGITKQYGGFIWKFKKDVV